MMVRSSIIAFLVILLCMLSSSCKTEPDTFVATGDESYFVPAGTDPIQYQVDSVIFDPSISGTDRIRSSSTWTLTLLDEDSTGTFLVSVQSVDSGSVATQRYLWNFDTYSEIGNQHSTQLDGFDYVNLVTPFTEQSSWDALLNADPNLSINIAGEPLAINKDWTTARIESIEPYTLPDGSQVDAVFVVLTEAENAIELREFKEVYGKGLGLLERSQRFLDTQQAGSTDPWEEKAENGFTVVMKRLF